MNDEERDARTAREDYESEQYDVDKDRAALEAHELAVAVRKQFIQEQLC